MGAPKIIPIIAPFILSLIHNPRVLLLKPYSCSITNCEYSSNGISGSDRTIAIKISVSACPHIDTPNTSIPKSNIEGSIHSASTTARNTAMHASSTIENFVLSIVYATAFLYAAKSVNFLNGAGTSPEWARTQRIFSASSHVDAANLTTISARRTITGRVIYLSAFSLFRGPSPDSPCPSRPSSRGLSARLSPSRCRL